MMSRVCLLRSMRTAIRVSIPFVRFHAPTTFDCSTDRPTEWCGSEHPGRSFPEARWNDSGLHFFPTSNVEPVGVEAESASGASRLAHIPTETEHLRNALAAAPLVLQELLTCLTVLADSERESWRASVALHHL